MGTPLLPQPPLTALPLSDICPDCQADHGLCHAERCRKPILPQLAKPALVRLIGETRTEQTKRQKRHGSPTAIEKVKRRNARKVARSSRRGYFGLAKAITGRQ